MESISVDLNLAHITFSHEYKAISNSKVYQATLQFLKLLLSAIGSTFIRELFDIAIVVNV